MYLNYKRTIKSISAALMLLPMTLTVANAQQNALDFDGIDDNVAATGASSLITNATGISIACWVYPRNAAPSFPDLDGIAGFRNNLDADFYLMQYSPSNNLESRFTNSSGTIYTMSSPVLQLNTWQHLVLTYDGSMMRLFFNTVQVDSLAASGVITNTTANFLVGNLVYTTNNFYLNGKVDEVSLWNKALSPSEITQIYGCGISNIADPNLKIYYDMNQGVANGNNAGLTTLTDKSGNLNGTLSGFALSGSGSNYVDGVLGGFNSITTQKICKGDSVLFNGQWYSNSGTYSDSLVSVNGCDSILKLILNVVTVDTSVVKSGNVLHANQNSASYSWYNCTTGLPAPGATLQNFLPQASGSYGCIIGYNGCVDTSSCWQVNFTGINENNLQSLVSVYPNPLDNILVVNFGKSLQQADITITDVNGKVVLTQSFSNSKQFKANCSMWTSGVYVLKITSANDTAVYRLMKK